MRLSIKLIYSFVLVSLFIFSTVSQPVGEELNSTEDKKNNVLGTPTEEKISDEIKKPTKDEKEASNLNKDNNELLKQIPRDLKTEESSSLPEKPTEVLEPTSFNPLHIFRECKGSLDCTEERLVSMIDRVDKEKSLPFFYGLVSVERTKEEENDEEHETPKSQEGLLSRLDRYLDNHSLRLHFLGLEEGSGARSLDLSLDSLRVSGDVSEGRSRSKWTKILLPVIIIFELMFFAFVPFFLTVLAVIGVTALQAGLGGILISAFLGLKSVLTSEKDKTRVTVVKPHVIPDVYHSDLLHGWSRSSLLDSYRGGYNPSVDPYRGYSSSSWDRPNLR